MGALTQDQLLQALNVHFHNTNQILDQLATHAATAQVAAAAPTAKCQATDLSTQLDDDDDDGTSLEPQGL